MRKIGFNLIRASYSQSTYMKIQLKKASDFILSVYEFREDKTCSIEVANGVVNTLASNSSGIQLSELLPTLKQLAQSYEMGKPKYLDSLVDAVEKEIIDRKNKQQISFSIKACNSKFKLIAYEGESLYDVIKKEKNKSAIVLREYIECACCGIMACSTCHVYVNKAWFDKVGKPCEAELDMLDLAYKQNKYSRLGCQLVFSVDLDGLELEVPNGVNNLMDYIPFEDKKYKLTTLS